MLLIKTQNHEDRKRPRIKSQETHGFVLEYTTEHVREHFVEFIRVNLPVGEKTPENEEKKSIEICQSICG